MGIELSVVFYQTIYKKYHILRDSYQSHRTAMLKIL